MLDKTNVKMLEKVVVRFSGDSGDGMQLAGNIFSNVSAGVGNQISTFPDYPAEIRAPQGTLSGVSGFQVHIGKGVHTPGDLADVLVSMNPAALKQNVKFLKPSGVAIVDIDSFKKADLDKALYKTDNPYEEIGLKAQVVEVPITSMVKAALADSGLDLKSILRCKNMFALGFICWLFDRPLESALHQLKNKFAKKPAIFEANAKVMQAGYDYGHNIHASVSTYRIESDNIRPGVYTDVNGNTATAWGLIMASEKSGRPLFLGSYPITPATDILHELAKRKDLGVKAEFSEANFDSLLASVDSKKTDSVANEITVTTERKAKYDFTEPYAYSYGVVVTRKNDNSIKSFDDIKGKKDAGQNGSNWAKVAQDKGATLVQVNDFSQAVETLTSGRADVIVNDGLAVLDYLKQKPNADIKIAVKSEKTPAAHFPLRKGSDDLTQAINKSIAKLRKDGTLKKISEKYFGEDISSK